MPQPEPSAVRPGDEVVVTITGTVATRNTATGTLTIRTADDAIALTPKSDDVYVAHVVPERPTLKQLITKHALITLYCYCGDVYPDSFPGALHAWHADHVAGVLREAGVAR